MPDFELFSTPHLIAMALTIVVPIALAAIARWRAAAAIGYLLAGALMINEVVSWRYRFVTFGFEQFVKEPPSPACLRYRGARHGCRPRISQPTRLRNRLLLGNGRHLEWRHHPRIGRESRLSVVQIFSVFHQPFRHRNRRSLRHVGTTDASRHRRALARLYRRQPLCGSHGHIQSRRGIQLHVPLRTPGSRVAFLLRPLALVHSHH